MRTIKDAIHNGCQVVRQIRYFAVNKHGISYELTAEANQDYMYNWKKFPKKRRKKSFAARSF